MFKKLAIAMFVVGTCQAYAGTEAPVKTQGVKKDFRFYATHLAVDLSVPVATTILFNEIERLLKSKDPYTDTSFLFLGKLLMGINWEAISGTLCDTYILKNGIVRTQKQLFWRFCFGIIADCYSDLKTKAELAAEQQGQVQKKRS